MAQLFANNIETTLSVLLSSTAVTATVTDATGMPTPTDGDYFLLTLCTRAASVESLIEIVKVTARSGNLLTIVRAQESTSGVEHTSGSIAAMRLTAGSLENVGIGDMTAATYDPTNVAGDAFDRTKHHGIPTLNAAIFDIAAGLSYATAQVRWSDAIDGLVVGSEEAGLEIPLTPTTFKVKNVEGSVLTALMVVRPLGATGGNATVELADATSFAGSRPVGLIRSATINNNATGLVTLIGPICDVDTSAWAEGTKLYLSATPGLPTPTKPAFPNYPVRVGVVEVSHATEGVVIVDSDPEHDLDQDLKIGSIPTFNVPSLNQARTEQEVKDLLCASSYYEGGAFTDNGTGTLKVATGKGFIRATNSAGAQLLSFTWAEHAAVSLTDNATNYIYVSYHATTPTINASTTKPTDSRTNVLLGKVFRDGTTVHLFKAGLNSAEFLANLIGRLTQTEGEITRASGGVVSETGTRNLSSTAAVVWGGLTPVATSSQDTSGTDTFHYFYYTGTDWTDSAQSQIDNLQYNNIASGLATLSNNQYGIHWVYLDPDGHQLVVYGQASYTLDDAQNAQPPASLPTHITQFCWLAGKVIIDKSGTSFIEIQSAYDTAFTHTTASDHNGLSNLQGGAADDYYHLTAAELAAIVYSSTASLSGFSWFLDEDDMSSNSAVKALSQRSAKVYSDRYGIAEITSRTVNLLTTDSTAQIQAKIDAVGKYLHNGVYITFQFADGTHTLTSTINFKGFYGGGRILIYGNTSDTGLSITKSVHLDASSYSSHALFLQHNAVSVDVNYLKISINSTAYNISGVKAEYSAKRVVVSQCYILGNGTTNGMGTSAYSNSAFMFIDRCYFSNMNIGALFQYTASGYIVNCDDTGTLPLYGVRAYYGAHVGNNITTTRIDGSTADESILYGTIV